MDETLKAQFKSEALATIRGIQDTAIDNCYSRYDIWAQLLGVGLAVGGGGLLSVLMPGGVIASATLAALVMGATTKMVADEADRIEAGDINAIQRYCSEETISAAIAPLAAKVEAAKKPLAQGTTPSSTKTRAETGNPSPELLPIAPVALRDDAPHLLLWGRTRAGKTHTARYLLSDSVTVHYVTVKATDTVPVNWTGYRLDPRTLNEQVTWLLDDWEGRFYARLDGQTEGTEWFLMDELITIKSQLEKPLAERLEAFIKQVITAGAAVGAFLGILTQSSNAGELGIAADLLKNCAIVGCTGQRKTNLGMAQAFAKYAGYRLTSEQLSQVKALDGYWQIWDNNGPCLSQISYSETDTKALDLCPVVEASGKGKLETLNDRIINFLRGQTEAKTARQIQQSVARKTDNPPIRSGDVREALGYLVSESFVMEEFHGETKRYWLIGT